VEKYSTLLDQRNQAQLQYLQNPSQTNGCSTNNIRREGSRIFRKNRNIWKTKLSLKQIFRTKVPETCLEKSYETATNLVKDNNGDLLAAP